jgi:translation initiation factor 3 subunit F
MLELHQRVSPKDVLVGWYSTGAGITDTDALIHDFFARECAAPVHLAIDTGFLDESRALRAWVGTPVSLGDAVVGTTFTELTVEHKFADAERAGLTAMAASAATSDGAPAALPADLAGLEASVQRLQAMLEVAHAYVDGVVEGRLKANNSIGRFLADTVAAVPRMPRDAFDKLFNDSVQDVLLVMYLSNLTRTQLALAERLNTPTML